MLFIGLIAGMLRFFASSPWEKTSTITILSSATKTPPFRLAPRTRTAPTPFSSSWFLSLSINHPLPIHFCFIHHSYGLSRETLDIASGSDSLFLWWCRLDRVTLLVSQRICWGSLSLGLPWTISLLRRKEMPIANRLNLFVLVLCFYCHWLLITTTD